MSELMRADGRDDAFIRSRLAFLGLPEILSLKELRKTFGVTAARLAELAGYDGGRSYVSRVENGRQRMTRKYRIAAAHALASIERTRG